MNHPLSRFIYEFTHSSGDTCEQANRVSNNAQATEYMEYFSNSLVFVFQNKFLTDSFSCVETTGKLNSF